ncbi:MAG: hypothetical protein UT82_C0006G0007 [Parcubacteria group bacterium GW2011_GWB1_40_14]|nr:MAG: hypothetical protein UT82_C0006G0007 [Parcubacteria group bacterium GW2011_GWB1_40_14]
MFLKNLWQRLIAKERWNQAKLENPSSIWPSTFQWSKLLSVLSLREKLILAISVGTFIIALVIWGAYFLNKHTKQTAAYGGAYTEAIVGQPKHINPILAPTNPADRDLSALIFSGLTRYDNKGNIVPDLAERWDILEDGKVYEFHLRPDLVWPDGESLNAQDVIFTIQKIQNNSVRNSLLPNWLSVKAEEGSDASIVKFTLPAPYSPFLQNTTVGILPRHLWAEVQNENFSGHELNTKPMGAGAYSIDRIERERPSGSIVSITLKPNEKYWDRAPYIQTLKFKFFQTPEEAADAYRQKSVDAMGGINASNVSLLRQNDLVISASLPRYFAIFFNQTASKIIADKTVRLALSYATDKNKILNEIWHGYGQTLDSPLVNGMLGYTEDLPKYDFAPDHARNILEATGWTDTDNDNIRSKGGNNLVITITTLDNPELTKTAEMLKSMWGAVGVSTEIKVLSNSQLRDDAIRPRTYEALLFGYELSIDPDPFSFWHSSQRFDPWPNLSLYNNKEMDKILEEARQKQNPDERAELYKKFQQTIIDDAPALFLVAPEFIYPNTPKLKGIEINFLANPSWRFAEIKNWHLKTKIELK